VVTARDRGQTGVSVTWRGEVLSACMGQFPVGLSGRKVVTSSPDIGGALAVRGAAVGTPPTSARFGR